jgi:thiamine pyrophosphate-dependent acetolactate synthase large subunit-like protein
LFDQRRFVEACEAKHVRVSNLDYAADEIAEAFYTAQAGRCPVVLDIANDLQDEELGWQWDYRPSGLYLPGPKSAAAEDIAVLADALMEAEKPVIVAGRGARNPPARDAILRLAELTGAILATSLQAKGLFQGEPYDVGIAGSYASAPSEGLFSDADFVLGVGAELNRYTAEAGLLFPMARIARIDIAPSQTLGWLPGLYVQGDAVKTVVGLTEELQRRGHRATGYRTSNTDAVLNQPPRTYDSPSDGLDARKLMRHLSDALPTDALITCGGGHFTSFAAMHLPIPKDVDFRVSIQFAAIAQTTSIAAGVGAGNPGRPHIMIEGDGSIMMNVHELETVARHKIPLVVLVMNDHSFGAEAHRLEQRGYDPAMAYYSMPDLVQLARSFGGDGVKLDREEDVTDAVRVGLAKGGLYVIDAHISPTEMSDDYRKHFHGQPNTAPLVRYQPAARGVA